MAETTETKTCRACGGEAMACSACGGAGRVTARRQALEALGDTYDQAFQDLRAHVDYCELCGWLGNACDRREQLIAAFVGLRSAVSLLKKGETHT